MVEQILEPRLKGVFTCHISLFLRVYTVALILELVKQLWELLKTYVFWSTLVENLRRDLQSWALLPWLGGVVHLTHVEVVLLLFLLAIGLRESASVDVIDVLVSSHVRVLYSIVLAVLGLLHLFLQQIVRLSKGSAVTETASGHSSWLVMELLFLLFGLFLLHWHWKYVLSHIIYLTFLSIFPWVNSIYWATL